MLVYHPMFDTYHCALRLSCIVSDGGEVPMEWDRLKVLDFFATFPHLLRTVRLPKEMRSIRAVFSKIAAPYEALPSPARLFFQLGEIQIAAGRLLVAGGFFDREAFTTGEIKLLPLTSNSDLLKIIDRAHFRSSDWYKVVTKDLSKFPLNGKNGLKERSGLMEFRHDPN